MALILRPCALSGYHNATWERRPRPRLALVASSRHSGLSGYKRCLVGLTRRGAPASPLQAPKASPHAGPSLAAAEPAAATSPALKVEFAASCPVAFGESVRIVGDLPELGSWDPRHGLELQWGEGHVWSAQVQLLPGTAISFKVVKVLRGGAVEWEGGDNRTLALPSLSKLLLASCRVKASCTFGHVSDTLPQLVGDWDRLQATVSATSLRASQLVKRREELRERLRALEVLVEESDMRLHELWQRVHTTVEQEVVAQQAEQAQQARVMAAAGSRHSEEHGSGRQQDEEKAAAPRQRPLTRAGELVVMNAAVPGGDILRASSSAPATAAALGAGVKNGGDMEEGGGHRAGRAKGKPPLQEGRGQSCGRVPWYTMSSMWESDGSSSGDEGAKLQPGHHMHIVEGTLRPAITPGMFKQSACEGEGEDVAEKTAAPRGELRAEFPGVRELSAATDGTLTFIFADHGPSAAELAEKYSMPYLSPAAAAALKRRCLEFQGQPQRPNSPQPPPAAPAAGLLVAGPGSGGAGASRGEGREDGFIPGWGAARKGTALAVPAEGKSQGERAAAEKDPTLKTSFPGVALIAGGWYAYKLANTLWTTLRPPSCQLAMEGQA